MREGMLWFDNNDERNLVEKIERAAKYYQAKYGIRPTLCYVYSKTIEAGPVEVENMRVKGTYSVMPNHLWLGMEDAEREECIP